MQFQSQLSRLVRAYASGDRLTDFYMATRLRISGRVQGVGFRYALQSEARRLGLAGWVRNRSDGSVEALAQGAPQSLDALTAWARRGPAAARVSSVQVEPVADGEAPHTGFELRPTE